MAPIIQAWLTLARRSVKIELPYGLVAHTGMSFLILLELFMPASDLRHFDLETLCALRQQQRDNLALLLQSAALVGGEEFASLELRNQLRYVRIHISELESEIARREADEAPAATSASPPAAPGSAQLRRLIEAAFTADEFEIFCFDHYRPVYSQFVSAMSQTQRIQRLIQYVEGKPAQVQNLLNLIRDANSAAYKATMTP